MKANRKARRNARTSTPDGGQMLLLAAFVIAATAIAAIGAYSALQTGSTQVTERANRPLLDLFMNTRDRAVEFFDLVTADDTAISVEEQLDDYLFSQFQTARSLSLQLNASLAGAGTDAPHRECQAFVEASLTSACDATDDYVDRDGAALWSQDGKECFSGVTYDGTNDGVITASNGDVLGAIFWLKVEGVETSLEEYVIIDVEDTSTNGDCLPWEGSWSTSTPASSALHDVAGSYDNVYAPGDSGELIRKSSGTWSSVSHPFGSTNLHGVDVTDDDGTVWLVGNSGSLGEIDLDAPTTVDDRSSTIATSDHLTSVAVTGDEGDAHLYVGDADGDVHVSVDDGSTWQEVSVDADSTKTAGAIEAIDFYDDERGFAVDANQHVWETTNGLDWTWATTLGQNLFGLDADGPHDVWVSGADGRVFHWDGETWSNNQVDSDGDELADLEIHEGNGYVVGDGGTVFQRDAGSWTDETLSTSQRLRAVTLSSEAIAVGGGGTVAET